MFRLLIVFFGLLLTTPLFAQTDSIPKPQLADTNLYRIVKSDGTDFIGYIIKQDEREVLIQIQSGRTFYIPQYEIKEIVPIKYGELDKEGVFVGEDRFATRYFLTTNGLPIKKARALCSVELIWT